MLKISELKGDNGAEMLIRLTAPTQRIANSKAVVALYDDIINADKDTRQSADFRGAKEVEWLTAIMSECREDVYEIISTLDCRPIEDVRADFTLDTLEKATLIFNDDSFLNFFRRFVVTALKR